MAKKSGLTISAKIEQEDRLRAKAINVLVSKLIDGTEDDVLNAIQNELNSNPALEQDMDNKDTHEQEPYDDGGEDENNAEDTESSIDNPYETSGDYDDDDDRMAIPQGGGSFSDYNARSEESLIENLGHQIGESSLNDKQKLIALHIVGNLDDNGWLTLDSYSIANEVSFKEGVLVDEDEVDEVLAVVQEMDPAGIGAHDLQECLLLQLKRRATPFTPLATRMVKECFNDFKTRRIDRIAGTLGVTVQEVNDLYREEIQKLDPRPGGGYSSSGPDGSQHVTPTFIITVEDGNIKLEVPNNIPELYISQSYQDVLNGFSSRKRLSAIEASEKKQIMNNIISASNLIRALEMRQNTLWQAMDAIVRYQRDYILSNGDVYALKPMKLENLSELTGRDTSILSRATRGKYVLTPWGTVSLKEFFSEGVDRNNPDGTVSVVSTSELKEVLQDIVNQEDKHRPLSDDNLCVKLKDMGYDIARRTVAKYRDELGIPKASMRKEY